jgi:hypothetical protein
MFKSYHKPWAAYRFSFNFSPNKMVHKASSHRTKGRERRREGGRYLKNEREGEKERG